MTQTKPGWKTTEFWLTLATVILTHVIGVYRTQPGLTGSIATLAASALPVAAYSISRGISKTPVTTG
jgi:hypothetical protein